MIFVSDVPELLAEWDYEENAGQFVPESTSVGNSKDKVAWKCKICNHQWDASPYNRNHLHRGCPMCGRKKRSEKLRLYKFRKGENDLASQRPELLNEWDYEENIGKFSPDEVTVGNAKDKVNWICSACGNKWTSTVYNRVHQNSGCPECAKKVISLKNRERRFIPKRSLVARFPEIAAEWHPTRNTGYDLNKVMPGNNEKVWWVCADCGKEFPARIINRTGYKHTGCPQCNKYMQTSFAEQAVFYYIKKVFPDAENKYRDIFENQMELDIFIPSLRTGIEYDGAYWHSKSTMARSKRKYEICLSQGIHLIRIKEVNKNYVPCEDDCDYTIWRSDEYDAALMQVIEEVISFLQKDTDLKINISRDAGEIKASYMISYKENSLLKKYPELCREWHPSKNAPLSSDMVRPAEHRKVWWLCPICGHSYDASPAKRTRTKPTGCPVCSNRKIIPGINDLATKRPDLAAEWHPTKNESLHPTTVAPNYSKKVWWKCSACGKEYHITPNKRVSRNQGCSECNKRNR